MRIQNAHAAAPLDISQAVRGLLERHGLPRHRHSSFVAEFFSLSRAASHQRVTKSTTWTADDLVRLAAHFGESLADLVGTGPAAPGSLATLRIGALEVGCTVWFHTEGIPAAGDTFVACERAGTYEVVPATAANTPGALRITRFEVDQPVGTPPRVAVLDNEPGAAIALCDQLRAAGIEATAFEAANALLAEIPGDFYDGYVIDWRLNEGDATPLLALIRAQARRSALVLLVASLREGKVDPTELASASSTFKVQVLEKPAHLSLVLSALQIDGLAS